MIQAAEEIKDSYNAQPQFAETGAYFAIFSALLAEIRSIS